MTMTTREASLPSRAPTLQPLAPALKAAEKGGYALGSFAPRYTSMIRPVLRGAMRTRSPLIVQISQREFERYGTVPRQFADAFFEAVEAEGLDVPVVLHLDHTFELAVIQAAMDAGFTSVMIDQSARPLDENIAVSAQVVRLAHARGVSVEAELGKIGTTDFIETDEDEEHFTDPDEALRFVNETQVDALAVAVGTLHGHYITRQPRVDIARLTAIRALTPVHLVLHGGSGVPPHMIHDAIQIAGGGVSKVNIATDLEHAMLTALGRTERLSDEACRALPTDQMRLAQDAVERTVADKIETYLLSAGKA
jgi:ketose-bisphosphate aldolase